MADDNIENKKNHSGESTRPEEQSSRHELKAYLVRRHGKDRRSGEDRRRGKVRRTGKGIFTKKEKRDGKERRSGKDRRSGQERRSTRKLRIPIFIKLTSLSTILILVVISIISFSILKKQKAQYIGQLINLGESMVRIVANSAPEKLLGEEDLALFQLVKDIAENKQVIYVLITDQKDVIKAHNRIDMVNKIYSPPDNILFLKEDNKVKVSSFIRGREEILLFEEPITYQKLRVGEVHLAISQRKILENIHDAKTSILVLTAFITLLGIMLSLALSMYFSRPIRKLGESIKALAMDDFDHRVAVNRNDELGDLGLAFNRMAEDLALKEKIKDTFGQYVTPEIVDMILENPDNQWMKGLKVEATVLFVDIRGFTGLAEEKEPETVIEMLNDHFTRVTDIVIRHGGHLNKFVGDEAMIVFGTPAPNPQHAEAAVRAALDIQEEIARIHRKKKMGDVSFEVGIGINSGEIVAGNLGSPKRMEYTVIGDNVNVASRLTSLAKAGEILISKKTYESIEDNTRLKVTERGKVSVKGKKVEITIFNVLGLDEVQDDQDSRSTE
ncbi:MAG: HAMP domain-containing protein [Desulfobacteraceae bacterium]|nr:MAG: HAMP domain-containing protein [Desulfobacteraceae bacterium]